MAVTKHHELGDANYTFGPHSSGGWEAQDTRCQPAKLVPGEGYLAGLQRAGLSLGGEGAIGLSSFSYKHPNPIIGAPSL